MFCNKCGCGLSDGAKFCPKCGEQVRVNINSKKWGLIGGTME